MNTNEERRARLSAQQLREKFKWKAVQIPRTWVPRLAGEEIIGFYGGKTVRRGEHGQYDVVIVHVPVRGALTISGVRIVQLFDAAGVSTGSPVRVIYQGTVDLATPGRVMKQFELLVPEEPGLDADDLPVVTV
jgi:hypothetical protein